MGVLSMRKSSITKREGERNLDSRVEAVPLSTSGFHNNSPLQWTWGSYLPVVSNGLFVQLLSLGI